MRVKNVLLIKKQIVMKYYVWELNEERKEIIFNKSEEKMGDMEALSLEQFNDYVKLYPDYKLVDLESCIIPVFNHVSSKHPDGVNGLMDMLFNRLNEK
jgi:hypothetical protein